MNEDLDGKAAQLNVTFYDEEGNLIPTPDLETLQQHEDGYVSINISIAVPVVIGFILLCGAVALFWWW